MSTDSLAHLSDGTLARDLAALVARDRITTATLLAHIAEFDARKLHLTAGQPSMSMYCLKKLHLSEEAAYKRIHAARAARRFPAIFSAVADRRLHLGAVILLAPHLTTENADGLLADAAHGTKAEIEALIARRFPRPDLPIRLEPISVPGTVLGAVQFPSATSGSLPHGPGIEHAPGRVDVPWPRPKVKPLAAERFGLQVTIGQETHRKLRHAQALLGSRLAANHLAGLLDRALDALIERLEKQQFAAASRPEPRARAAARPMGRRATDRQPEPRARPRAAAPSAMACPGS